MKVKQICRLVIITIALVSGAPAVFGCSSADPSLRQRFRSADSVFIGEVVEFKERPWTGNEQDDIKSFPYQVKFKIEKQWKGSRSDSITALADFDSPSMCNDLSLEVGRRLLVFAPRTHGHLLVYRDCGPNRGADYAKDEIKRLNTFFFRAYTFFYPYPTF